MRNKVRKSEACALARDHTSNLGKAFCSTLYTEIGKKVSQQVFKASDSPHQLYFRGKWREAAEGWGRRSGREDTVSQVHFLHPLNGGLRAILLLWNEK